MNIDKKPTLLESIGIYESLVKLLEYFGHDSIYSMFLSIILEKDARKAFNELLLEVDRFKNMSIEDRAKALGLNFKINGKEMLMDKYYEW